MKNWSILLLLFAFCCGSSLNGQCDPGGGLGGTGADVIVGELYSPNSYGSAGGYYAYSIGTTSCNIGTQELLWIAGTNEHPVIAQNMYRLLDGRFEHIGMSWLKHGFTALQGNACGCGCQSSGTGTRLGVGCSDPYSASLNGSQGSLGARSEVTDPANGGFIYPPILDPANPDLTWRRLRVHGSDLDPALNIGALYFIEGHYVTPDDAAAGNAHNNASYRQISVANSSATHPISLVGTTMRQQPGIQAWQDFDPSVTLVDIPDGDGGLLILGYKVTPVGSAGLHQYEYALYNMNSSRGIRAFSLPLPGGVIASDIGFHDAEYHSGEPYDGTDWQVNVSADSITWSCDSFASNPNSSALRWGSLCNFRFLATSGPAAATLSLERFAPGSGTLLTTTVLGPTASTLDCNNNGIPDVEELAAGAPDCDGNGLLDECQADCDGDGTADACEILSGASDCDLDGIPDSCQIAGGAADCDFDGILDACEIDQGTESDCNGNGIIDSCDIDAGELDCDANGIPDICESSGIFSFDDVLNPPEPIADNLPDVVRVIAVGQPGLLDDVDVSVDLNHTFIGDLSIDLVNPAATSVLLHNQGGGSADDLNVLYDDDGSPGSTAPAQALSAFDGSNALGDWTLTVDDLLGGDSGQLNSWGIDLAIAGTGFPDCNNNGVHDGCDLASSGDCNGNGILDECDIASGTSSDSNGDGIPDECSAVVFLRGDVNSDSFIDISDPVSALDYLFGGGAVPCLASVDANGDGNLDISDSVALLVLLFGGGAPLPAPYPDCGTETTGSGLPCGSFPGCP